MGAIGVALTHDVKIGVSVLMGIAMVGTLITSHPSVSGRLMITRFRLFRLHEPSALDLKHYQFVDVSTMAILTAFVVGTTWSDAGNWVLAAPLVATLGYFLAEVPWRNCRD